MGRPQTHLTSVYKVGWSWPFTEKNDREINSGDLTYALASSPTNGYREEEGVATSKVKGWTALCNDSLHQKSTKAPSTV